VSTDHRYDQCCDQDTIDVEAEAKTKAAGFETEAEAKAVASETEAKAEAV